MNAHKMIRILCNVGIGVLLSCFVLGVLWFITGSFEMEPTAEQVEKARISASMLMMATGIPCAACICFRIKYRK